MDTANLQNKYQIPKLTKKRKQTHEIPPQIRGIARSRQQLLSLEGHRGSVAAFWRPPVCTAMGLRCTERSLAVREPKTEDNCAPPPSSSSSSSSPSSTSPSASQALVLTRKDLNDIDSRINFLHEIMSAGACSPSSPSPSLPQPWASEVPNNYISFQRLIWLRAIIQLWSPAAAVAVLHMF